MDKLHLFPSAVVGPHLVHSTPLVGGEMGVAVKEIVSGNRFLGGNDFEARPR